VSGTDEPAVDPTAGSPSPSADGFDAGPPDRAGTTDAGTAAAASDAGTADGGGADPGPADPWPAGGPAPFDHDAVTTEEITREAADAVSEDLDLLDAALDERDEYLDALRRLQADFENYKKRVAKQHAETASHALEDLVTKLLPVLDTVDLARAHGASEGVEQLAGPLVDILTKEGLERVDPKGEPFDPTQHDAVMHEEGDGGPTVVEVFRAGWRWKGKVLRPAMVKVAG
jgi:molecular chaperone GrpE